MVFLESICIMSYEYEEQIIILFLFQIKYSNVRANLSIHTNFWKIILVLICPSSSYIYKVIRQSTCAN